jgi:3-oxo-5-alpha-steroid 4-dehydrogenase 3
VFEAIASRVSEEHLQQSMSLTQLLICWILLAIQGSRRLWESITFAKPSSSKMGFAHWLLGLGFYLAAGIAIWIEGSGMETHADQGSRLRHLRISDGKKAGHAKSDF